MAAHGGVRCFRGLVPDLQPSGPLDSEEIAEQFSFDRNI